MNVSETKNVLLDMTDDANEVQLNELFGLTSNCFNSKANEEWEQLSEQQRSVILQSVSEAEKGQVSPLSAINKRLRKKYDLLS